MAAFDDSMKLEGFGHLFEKIGQASAEAGEKLSTDVIKYPGRASERGAKFGSEAVSRNSKAALSTIPDVMNFYNTGTGS